MNVKWTKGLSAADAEEFRLIYASSHRFRQRFEQLIKNEGELKSRVNLKDAEYDSPSWAYKQADNIGYMRAIEDILELLK